MTLSNIFLTNRDTRQVDSGVDELSTDWKSLYNSELRADGDSRREGGRAPVVGNGAVTARYTCRGKVRHYEVTPPRLEPPSSPSNHSTPRDHNSRSRDRCAPIEGDPDPVRNVPSISSRVDSLLPKYTCPSYALPRSDLDASRLGRGPRPILNLASNESLDGKKTRLKACSIGVVGGAVVMICLLLVNFATPPFPRATSAPDSRAGPGEASSSAGGDARASPASRDAVPAAADSSRLVATTEAFRKQVLATIRNNVKTYPKVKPSDDRKPKEMINRDLSLKFCACQSSEVCMLDEDSGTAICKNASDGRDPTGCGGLCALETEACQLVDRERGIRVCRRLSPEPCAWRCRDGLCVAAAARCDGTLHCYDRSDEKQCECDLSKQFRCGHSLSCFSNTKLCDGVVDCWDGYDEADCTLECTDAEFACNNGQCIRAARFCDGLADCADASDEPRGCDAACGARELRCANRRCVSLELRCDGRDDCGDASDESPCLLR